MLIKSYLIKRSIKILDTIKYYLNLTLISILKLINFKKKKVLLNLRYAVYWIINKLKKNRNFKVCRLLN